MAEETSNTVDEAEVAPMVVPDVPPGQLDARRNAFRVDLADQRLEGEVSASRFVEGREAVIARPSVPLRRGAQASAPVDSEALFGEHVTVFDRSDGWAWVQLGRDRYVGYVPCDTLSASSLSSQEDGEGDEAGRAGLKPSTHHVRAIGTFVYPAPDIKTPPLMHLSLNSELVVVDSHGIFYELDNGGFVASRHVAPITKFCRDFVEVAERFIGTPYLWGGRTRVGIDCSGLVQVALQAAGIDAPRDSDMQLEELGTTVLVPSDLEGLVRGDLVFWDGHVGIMSDGFMLLHANAHHMAVTFETLPEACERIANSGSKIAAIKRIGSAGV